MKTRQRSDAGVTAVADRYEDIVARKHLSHVVSYDTSCARTRGCDLSTGEMLNATHSSRHHQQVTKARIHHRNHAARASIQHFIDLTEDDGVDFTMPNTAPDISVSVLVDAPKFDMLHITPQHEIHQNPGVEWKINADANPVDDVAQEKKQQICHIDNITRDTETMPETEQSVTEKLGLLLKLEVEKGNIDVRTLPESIRTIIKQEVDISGTCKQSQTQDSRLCDSHSDKYAVTSVVISDSEDELCSHDDKCNEKGENIIVASHTPLGNAMDSVLISIKVHEKESSENITEASGNVDHKNKAVGNNVPIVKSEIIASDKHETDNDTEQLTRRDKEIDVGDDGGGESDIGGVSDIDIDDDNVDCEGDDTFHTGDEEREKLGESTVDITGNETRGDNINNSSAAMRTDKTEDIENPKDADIGRKRKSTNLNTDVTKRMYQLKTNHHKPSVKNIIENKRTLKVVLTDIMKSNDTCVKIQTFEKPSNNVNGDVNKTRSRTSNKLSFAQFFDPKVSDTESESDSSFCNEDNFQSSSESEASITSDEDDMPQTKARQTNDTGKRMRITNFEDVLLKSSYTVHTKYTFQANHACEVCNAKLKSRKVYLGHMTQDHGIYVSHMMKKGVDTVAAADILSHDCSVCNKRHINQKHLSIHMQTLHMVKTKKAEKAVFSCNVCGKKGTSREHLTTHGRQKHAFKLEQRFKLVDEIHAMDNALYPFLTNINCLINSEIRYIPDKREANEKFQHESYIQCDICGGMFFGDVHMKRHLSEVADSKLRHPQDAFHFVQILNTEGTSTVTSTVTSTLVTIGARHRPVNDCEQEIISQAPPQPTLKSDGIKAVEKSEKDGVSTGKDDMNGKDTKSNAATCIHKTSPGDGNEIVDVHKSDDIKENNIAISEVQSQALPCCASENDFSKETTQPWSKEIPDQVSFERNEGDSNTQYDATNVDSKPEVPNSNHSDPILNERYICTLCKDEFSSLRSALTHIGYYHVASDGVACPYVYCDQCGVVLQNHDIYMSHVNTFHSKQMDKAKLHVACPMCACFDGGSPNELETHVKTSHYGPFECSICGLHLPTPTLLKHHTAEHTIYEERGIVLFRHMEVSGPCPVCGVTKTVEGNLDIHILLAHGDYLPGQAGPVTLSTVYIHRTHWSITCDLCKVTLPHCGPTRVLVKDVHFCSGVTRIHHPSGQQSFWCSSCSLLLADAFAFKHHLALVHADEIHERKTGKLLGKVPTCMKKVHFKIECAICKQRFDSKLTELVTHMETHKGKVTCDICGEQVVHFQKHKARVHTENRFPCPYCGQTFKVGEYLNKHITARHTEVKECDYHSCSQCTKKFKTKRNMLSHYRWVHLHRKTIPKGTLEEVKCSLCSWTYSHVVKKSRIYRLKQHERSMHFGIRPYECGTCGKSFSNQTALCTHRKLHDPSKRFKCEKDGCGKVFTQKCSLDRHLLAHDGIKKYVCEWCGEKFAQSYPLTQHIKTKHPEHLEAFVKRDLKRMQRKL